MIPILLTFQERFTGWVVPENLLNLNWKRKKIMKQTASLETAEHVLPGHPDKLCDASVDAIVDFLRHRDPRAQCGLEMACVFDKVVITGRIAAKEEAISDFNAEGGCSKFIRKAYRDAGYGSDRSSVIWGPIPEQLQISEHLCLGAFAEEESELRHLSDDQAICVGYARADLSTNYMPPAAWLSRAIAWELFNIRKEHDYGEMGPDGKVLVRVEKKGTDWKPVHVSLSLSHHEDSDWLMLRCYAEMAVEKACEGLAMPKISLNGAGMFISVGPNGDNGLSGKKLVADAYGPTIPIGGGAWSGKDLHKVDRLGGLLSRKLANQIIRDTNAEEALVQLEYQPGSEKPAAAVARINGQNESICVDKLLHGLNLNNENVWQWFSTCQAPLDELARWGHQQPGTPWELGI